MRPFAMLLDDFGMRALLDSRRAPGQWYLLPRRLWTYADVERALAESQPGSWRAVVRLPHEEVEHDGWAVPSFEPDAERAAWRRRKWWGRHLLDTDMAGRWWRWAGVLPMGQEWEPVRAFDGRLAEPLHAHWWWAT